MPSMSPTQVTKVQAIQTALGATTDAIRTAITTATDLMADLKAANDLVAYNEVFLFREEMRGVLSLKGQIHARASLKLLAYDAGQGGVIVIAGAGTR